ncbi:MAG: carboxypeptidase-like regulatory domain-containing protein, partial [Pyrinomonadaceae bacterium]
MKPIITRAITLSILTICLIFTASGQSDSGSAAIEGTVKDQNGAIVQGATVVIKNKNTGLERTVTSNANGLF